MAKKLLSSSEYTFNANTGTVTFGDSLTGLELQNVELITNVTTNTVIYQFNKSGFGGSLTGLILTLDYDTSAMSDSDDLQIFIEGDFIRSDTNESIILLRRIAQLLSPIATQDSNQRQRVTVDIMPTVSVTGTVTSTVTGTLSAVTTVSTVSNIAAIGGVDPRFQFVDAARTAYATGIRANLTNP